MQPLAPMTDGVTISVLGAQKNNHCSFKTTEGPVILACDVETFCGKNLILLLLFFLQP